MEIDLLTTADQNASIEHYEHNLNSYHNWNLSMLWPWVEAHRLTD